MSFRLRATLYDVIATIKWARGQHKCARPKFPWWIKEECTLSPEEDRIDAMSEDTRTVQMCVISPGSTAPDGEFTFELQPRYNPGRTVKFALIPSDAETLQRALSAYLKEQVPK
jgi:hypothetical protein